MAQLRAYKDTGTILFDTNLISYGLSKSGYMTGIQAWTRRRLLSAQLDPDNGANYSAVVIQPFGTATCDQLWGFSISNAVSPIIFISGSGCLVGTSISGSNTTFLYTNASTSTKFYCFDLMADSSGSPYLKTYDSTGRITFNSLMPPINIVAAMQPPGPAALDIYGRYTNVYNGGSIVRITADYNVPNVASVINYSLSPGVEYAAHLTFSRSAGVWDTRPRDPTVGPVTTYSASEGAYGRNGGMSFIMAATAGGSTLNPSTNQVTTSWVNIPTDRIPTALMINTASYPFPFN